MALSSTAPGAKANVLLATWERGVPSAKITEPRLRNQQLAQSFQRADIAVARGRLLQAQHGRRLIIGEHLEMAQRQYLAIDGVHAVERLLHADLQLGPHDRLADRSEAPQQLRREILRRRLRQGAAV